MALTKEMARAHVDLWADQKRRADTAELALRAVVDDVLEYERINNLSPNPGRKYCLDSVAQAVAVLERD